MPQVMKAHHHHRRFQPEHSEGTVLLQFIVNQNQVNNSALCIFPICKALASRLDMTLNMVLALISLNMCVDCTKFMRISVESSWEGK